MVEGFEGHAAGEGPVSDDREDPVVFIQLLLGFSQPDGDGDGIARMAGVEDVVGALVSCMESRSSPPAA